MKFWNDWRLVGMACVTLGLAPFFPEPHIWGKLKWILLIRLLIVTGLKNINPAKG
jgi:hypothetical protein